MAVSLPGNLANVTLASLKFMDNCSNIALGYQVWSNDFYNTSLWSDDGSDYSDWWANGTPPDFIEFWRGALGTVLPDSYLNFTDEQIDAWTKHDEFYDFFYVDTYKKPMPNNLPDLTKSLAGPPDRGCNSKAIATYSTDLEYYSYYQQACMLHYCCDPRLSKGNKTSQEAYPYFDQWNIEGACSFDTCTQENKGNPDLGGIGVLVAYFIEMALLFLSLLFFGSKLVSDWYYGRTKKPRPRWLFKHDIAGTAAAGVFIDSAVYFSFAINFASIIFNFSKDKPLLYEDKLGQTSSLLGIDTPVAMLVMSYKMIDRRNLRVIMVFLAALMTFIIQFLFRRAHSFQPSTSLCLAWDDKVQQWFEQRFIAKAVWACLLLLYILWASADHLIPSRWLVRYPSTSMLPMSPPVKASQWQSFKASKPYGILHKTYTNFALLRIVGLILAAYGLFAIIIDVRFILFLRHQEKNVDLEWDEDKWGYGQILAVFVWVPVFIEYVYVVVFKRGIVDHGSERTVEAVERRDSYEMVHASDEAFQKRDPQPHAL